MNYRNPQLRDMLAGEYVLGTLAGPARRRFEQLLRDDYALRDTVGSWERRLAPLVDAVPAMAPPKRVWRNIEQRVAPKSRSSAWNRVGFWRPLGIFASMAFVVVVGYVLVDATKEVPQPPAPAPIAQAPAPVPATEYVALLNDQKAQPVWVVTAADFKQITVKVVAPPKIDADKAYELWLLPGENQPPRSLGLLPLAGTKTVTVPAELQTAMAAGKVLAVSLEPTGGSPTGLPTGPVLYTGLLVTTS